LKRLKKHFVFLQNRLEYCKETKATMESAENLAMLSELALASLVLPNLINPALDKVT
jgi:hypothetical protein